MKRSDLYEYQNFSVGFLKEHPEALLFLHDMQTYSFSNDPQ